MGLYSKCRQKSPAAPKELSNVRKGGLGHHLICLHIIELLSNSFAADIQRMQKERTEKKRKEQEEKQDKEAAEKQRREEEEARVEEEERQQEEQERRDAELKIQQQIMEVANENGDVEDDVKMVSCFLTAYMTL